MTFIRSSPIIGAFIAQLIAGAVMVVMRMGLSDVFDPITLILIALAVQCSGAAMLAYMMKLPSWWVVISFLFPLALTLALSVDDLPGWPFGVAFVLLYLFFSNTARERVPLYLSNSRTTNALLKLMEQCGSTRFTDLGSGLGGVVRTLDGGGRRARGVETAPMVWFMSLLLSKLTGRGEILRQDIWASDISQEDMVYAFLSPEPMSALYKKAKAEMKPGSLFVSNSFAVPNVKPDEIWELPDRRKTKLFLYKIQAQDKLVGKRAK